MTITRMISRNYPPESHADRPKVERPPFAIIDLRNAWYQIGSRLLMGLLLLVFPCQALGTNWPAWRSDGSGVTAEVRLATEWNSRENVVWKTVVETEGHSSPIVWEDRVFVTGARQKPLFDGKPPLWLALCLLLVVLSWRTFGAKSTEATGSHGAIKTLHRIDRWGTTLAIWLACAGWVFLCTDHGLRWPEHLHTLWDYSGVIGIVACVAASGLFPVRSVGRMAGAILTGAALLFFLANMPHAHVTAKHTVLAGSTLCVLLWWCILFFATSSTSGMRTPSRFAGMAQILGSVVLTSAAWFQFAVLNYLPQNAMWTRVVTCLASDTGKVLWVRDCFRALPLKKHVRNSYATPTAVTDGNVVVAQFDTGILCLDFQGHVKWQKTTPGRSKHIHCGLAASPIMFEDLVIYAFIPDGPGPSLNGPLAVHSELCALDKETGEVKWQIALPGGHDSYNTPLSIEIAGRPILIIATWETVLVYDPRNGAQIRSWELPITQCIPSIVATRERAYVMSGRSHGSRGGFAIDLALDKDGKQPNIAWHLQRATADIASPVLVDGRLFMVNQKGIASCLEADSGKVLWRKRLGGIYFSSVVAGDGKVYFTSLDGMTTVVASGREFVKLATNEIGEEVASSHAISNGRLFIRGETHLFCIGRN